MQCTRTITLPCLLFELSSFIKFSCPGHNSKTIQRILLKPHIVIKDIASKCSVCEPYLPCFLNYFPLLNFLGHNSKTIQGILLKVHIVIKDIERKCIVQEP